MKYNYFEERENFMHVSPEMTGLKMELRIDVNQSFEMFRHPLVVYIANTYSKWGREFVVVTVEEHPRIVQMPQELKLFVRDLNEAIAWIRDNRQLLKNVADNSLDDFEFIGILRTCRYGDSVQTTNKRMYESSTPLNEMAILNKNISGLSFDIWFDQDETYKKGGHWRRLKVRPKNGSNNTYDWFSFILPTKPEESGAFEKENEAKQFSGKEIKNLNRFVEANLDLIIKLSDKVIDFNKFELDFVSLPLIKKGVTAKNIDDKKIRLFDAEPIEGTNLLTKTYKDDYGTTIYVITRMGEDEMLTKEKYAYIFSRYREDERGRFVVAIDFYDKHNNIYIDEL